MKTKIIVDGYNVLKTTPQFASLQAQSLEVARDTLVNLLNAKGHIYDITVVFDAWNTEFATQRESRVRNVRVIYTKRGERADQVIARLAASARADCIVVSGDSEVRSSALASGCQVAAPESLIVLPKRRGPHRRTTPPSAEETDSSRHRASKKGPSRRPKKKPRHPEWHF